MPRWDMDAQRLAYLALLCGDEDRIQDSFTYRRLLSIRIGRYCIYDCYLDFFIHFLLPQTESYGGRPISRSLQTSSTIPTPR